VVGLAVEHQQLEIEGRLVLDGGALHDRGIALCVDHTTDVRADVQVAALVLDHIENGVVERELFVGALGPDLQGGPHLTVLDDGEDALVVLAGDVRRACVDDAHRPTRAPHEDRAVVVPAFAIRLASVHTYGELLGTAGKWHFCRSPVVDMDTTKLRPV
jgi:hypothetical protein